MRTGQILGLLGILAIGAAAACSAAEEEGDDESADSEIQAGRIDTEHGFAVGIELQGGQVCSGVLIAPNLVMTAQHCVSTGSTKGQVDCQRDVFAPQPLTPPNVKVTTDARLPGKSRYAVRNVIVPESRDYCGSDIALLVLDKNVPATEAKPATPMLRSMGKASTRVAAIGYGVTSSGGRDSGERRIRENIQVTCVPGAKGSSCKNSDHQREFQTAGGVCEGDSGSGAFEQASIGRTPVVLGVLARMTTRGSECTTGVYTRTDMYARLLIGAAVQAANAGNYPAPAWSRPEDSKFEMPQLSNARDDRGGRDSRGGPFGNDDWSNIIDWLGGWFNGAPTGADPGFPRDPLGGSFPYPGFDGGLEDGGVDAGSTSVTAPAGGDRQTEDSTSPPSDDPPAEDPPSDDADSGADAKKTKKKKKAGGCSTTSGAPTGAGGSALVLGVAAIVVARARRRPR